MGFFTKVDDVIHDVIRGVKKWGSKDATRVEDTQRQDITTESMRSMDRGILNSGVIMRAPDYERVKHNSSVQSLIRRIDNYEAAMSRMRIPQGSLSDSKQSYMSKVAEVNGEVFEYMQEMQAFLIQKAQYFASLGKRYNGVMGVCATAATNIRTQMDYVNKIQEKCFHETYETWDIPFGESYANLLKDLNWTNIFQETDLTERKFLGQGGINTVYTVKDEERNTNRVLKEGHMDIRIKSEEEISKLDESEKVRETNIRDGNKVVYQRIRKELPEEGKSYTMNTAHRDVAVSMIDKLFNLNAAVDTSMARSKSGNQASLMDKAEGTTVGNAYAYMGEKNRGQAELLKLIMMNERLLKTGSSHLTEQDYEKQEEIRKRAVVNIDSAEFLESTYNLAALDIIVGHVDRHVGNMMMTSSGVKGIDNDSAFSLKSAGQILGHDTKEMTMAEARGVSHQYDSNRNRVEAQNTNQAYLFFDKAFPYVTEAFRYKITSVSASAVRGVLKGLIQDDEIEACVERVETLQAYLKNMPDDKVVQSFDEIDRQKYSSETLTDYKVRLSTNIMSQVRGKNGGDYFDGVYEKLLEVKDFSPEFGVMKSYVTRMGGCAQKNIDEATATLMYHLGSLAIQGKFLFGKNLSDNNLESLDDFYKNEIVPEFKETPKPNKEGDTVA